MKTLFGGYGYSYPGPSSPSSPTRTSVWGSAYSPFRNSTRFRVGDCAARLARWKIEHAARGGTGPRGEGWPGEGDRATDLPTVLITAGSRLLSRLRGETNTAVHRNLYPRTRRPREEKNCTFCRGSRTKCVD